MLSPPQKAGKMLKFIKQRLSGASDKTSNKITQSNLVSSLMRTVQSTPDLLKIQQQEPSERVFPSPLSQNATGELPPLKPTPTSSSKSLKMNCVASSPGCMQSSYLQEERAKPMPAEEILFSPTKESFKSPKPKKMKINFALGKKKRLSDSQGIGEAALDLPMITLTTPDDEGIYVLHRPTPPISSQPFLAVPNRSCSTANTSEPRKVSAKKWPHPAGPWLRPSSPDEYLVKSKNDQLTWQEGWRLATGRVIGWDPESMDALGIAFPPQLPTEQDLKTIALIQQISNSLDQAQDALYRSMEVDWDSDLDDDDDDEKMLEETLYFPDCVSS
ncbi:hypothetical protein PGT21_008405 [Puccinia graminis f. sp. tritici]|uniref:Uncharacterized protein n=1 Tax=Puccinia graminis f. sp. tritici TaxID=56615 RepID=A0A5B0PTM7_PUCGR|nr:hypothetical protein PGT21_008405 [Puccinia graminis f. sp. tritici]KAA1128281.1 hypothetical protein PGTUg99_021190 [Puccinia graminis f. sp. tritici]